MERRCISGICALPQPRPLGPQQPNQRVQLEISAGPSFPSGWLVHVDAMVVGRAVPSDRRVTIGLGGDFARGDFGWRFGVAGGERKIGPLYGWLWTSLFGLSLRDGAAASFGAGLQGATASGLLQGDRPQSALWWGLGGGLGWAHGERRQWRLRLEVGALTLVGGRYPPEADYPIIPSVSLRYGVAF